MKYIIDEVTKTDKYVTGHENGTVFGLRTIPTLGMYDNYHIGNDYNTPQGTPLYAPVKCEVLRKVDYNDDTGYGYALFLYMIDYNKTLHLSHLSKFADIKEGQIIDKGTLVAYSGGLKGTEGAGTSTGAHLHLGIASGKKRDTVKGKLGDGTWLDPSKFDFNDTVKVQPSFDEVVQGVIDGKYGNGQARVNAVNATGHNYDKVQEKVNERLAGAKPKPQPSKPSFSPYNYSLAKGSTLYDSKGNAYAYPTTQAHTVKVLKENNGMGLIREPWLVGVSEAWIKLGAKPKPVFKPYNKTLPSGSKLYDANGNAYAYPTTNTHTVKVLKEKNGLGLIRENWLVGVSEAWIKL